MKRVLIYLGMGSTATSKMNMKSAAAIRGPSFPEIDAPNNNSVLAVSRPHPNDETVSTAGTKDETFFDSQAWLESDCEDFYSVQGDKTPSVNASPVRLKKTLRELLSESFDRRKDIETNILAEEKPEEDLPNTSYKLQRRKSSRSTRHCLPSLVRSLSCSEWKKKTALSPVHISQY